MTERVVWHVVKQAAGKVGILKLAPHDLRRSCARLCHRAGGELEQIQFLPGYVSVHTTEKYLGCKQRLWLARKPMRFAPDVLSSCTCRLHSVIQRHAGMNRGAVLELRIN
ncbi:MAG: hypothetical protein DMG36_18750 [Acidobacteria bacterium]|nr:MAG: hypothetical protein DMG36_18750 [Acidobacteriota bacterium]